LLSFKFIKSTTSLIIIIIIILRYGCNGCLVWRLKADNSESHCTKQKKNRNNSQEKAVIIQKTKNTRKQKTKTQEKQKKKTRIQNN